MIAISSGSVSRANMRLSIVNGTAFVDFSSAGALTNYLGYKLVITDSASKTLTGYIKAAGTGETLSSEMLTDGAMENWNSTTDLTSWIETIGGSSTVNQESSVKHAGSYSVRLDVDSSGTYVAVRQNTSGSSGVLTKITFWAYSSLSSKVSAVDLGSVNLGSGFNPGTTWTQYTVYGVNPTSSPSLYLKRGSSNCSVYFDDVSATQVLTASATGITITSTANGSTYNWETEDSGFNRNDSSGYTYAIYPGTVKVTLSSGITTGPMLIDGENVAGTLGVDVTAADTLLNYTIVRCPAGAIQATESCTIKNTIGISDGNDITIASGKTVTGTSNLFGDAAKAGSGTYTDVSGTQWATDPLFVGAADFHLQSSSPAINAGVDVGLTEDYDGNPIVGLPDIGAFEAAGGLSIPVMLAGIGMGGMGEPDLMTGGLTE